MGVELPVDFPQGAFGIVHGKTVANAAELAGEAQVGTAGGDGGYHGGVREEVREYGGYGLVEGVVGGGDGGVFGDEVFDCVFDVGAEGVVKHGINIVLGLPGQGADIQL